MPDKHKPFWLDLQPGDMLVTKPSCDKEKPIKILIVQVRRFTQMPFYEPSIDLVMIHPLKGMIATKRDAFDHVCDDYDVWPEGDQDVKLADEVFAVRCTGWFIACLFRLFSRCIISELKMKLFNVKDEYYRHVTFTMLRKNWKEPVAPTCGCCTHNDVERFDQ